MNKVAIIMHMQCGHKFLFLLGKNFHVGLLDCMDKYTFNLLRSCQTIFPNGYNTKHNNYSCPTSLSLGTLFYCHFLLSYFVVTLAILIGLQCYLTVVATCISLMINDGEHFC